MNHFVGDRIFDQGFRALFGEEIGSHFDFRRRFPKKLSAAGDEAPRGGAKPRIPSEYGRVEKAVEVLVVYFAEKGFKRYHLFDF